MKSYLTSQDQADLEKSQTFEECLEIALRMIKRMPQPVALICGPMTTGGKGAWEENLAVFARGLEWVTKSGEEVFNPLPFESHLQRIKGTPCYKRRRNHLLETFWRPILESGLIRKIYFLPDWQTSQGAQWEHAQAVRLGTERIYLTIV